MITFWMNVSSITYIRNLENNPTIRHQFQIEYTRYAPRQISQETIMGVIMSAQYYVKFNIYLDILLYKFE
ncbi:unnamed protein product [Ambrosiozyma monospora]|uniref:Unnamed protein product n=1 Tax=Ambrosiozyma monospora TaxID=43982 RepID=A0A9W7DGJ0_AMBMO|nr:unnamed protein product [Ambrosiozyma monospora]